MIELVFIIFSLFLYIITLNFEKSAFMLSYHTRRLFTNNFSTISRGGSVFGNFPIIIIIPHGGTLRARANTSYFAHAPTTRGSTFLFVKIITQLPSFTRAKTHRDGRRIASVCIFVETAFPPSRKLILNDKMQIERLHTRR